MGSQGSLHTVDVTMVKKKKKALTTQVSADQMLNTLSSMNLPF